MNAEDLQGIAAVIYAIDKALEEFDLTLHGSVSIGDANSPARLGFMHFNDGSETTLLVSE